MTTKDTINKMEKELDEEFPNLRMYYTDGIAPCEDEVKSFIHSHIRSLLSAFAEEVIGKEEEILTAHELMTKNKSMNKSIADWEEGKQMGKSVLRAEQRLKAKEIISSIGK